jgi:hypothetical protein
MKPNRLALIGLVAFVLSVVLLIIRHTSVRIMWHSRLRLSAFELPIECSLVWKARFPLSSRLNLANSQAFSTGT